MFYAIYHWYHVGTISAADELWRLPTKAERDAVVNNEIYNGNGYHWTSVTRDQARRQFPRAFRSHQVTCPPGTDYYDARDMQEQSCGSTVWLPSAMSCPWYPPFDLLAYRYVDTTAQKTGQLAMVGRKVWWSK